MASNQSGLWGTVWGLVPLDPRFSTSTLDRSLSNFTESGPLPGIAEPSATSSAVPVISYAQESEIVTRVTKGGNPTPDRGAELGYRLSSEAATSTRFASPLNVITGYRGLRNDKTFPATQVALQSVDLVTIPSSGLVLVTYIDDTSPSGGGDGPGVPNCITLGDDGLWSSPVIIVDLTCRAIGSVVLPSGRIVVFVRRIDRSRVLAYSSTDQGATWSLWSPDCGIVATPRSYPLATDGDDWIRVAWHPSGLAMAIGSTGTANWSQYASSDEGSTFDLVATHTSHGYSPTFRTMATGDLGFTWIRYDATPADKSLKFTRIGSAYQDITTSTAITIDDSGGWSATTLLADPSGVTWLYAATILTDRILAWYSFDSGASWTAAGYAVLKVGTSQVWERFVATPWYGGAMLVGTNDTTDFASVLTLGKFSNLAYPVDPQTQIAGFGYGARYLTSSELREAAGWIPIALPEDGDWTKTGTAATLTQHLYLPVATATTWAISTLGATMSGGQGASTISATVIVSESVATSTASADTYVELTVATLTAAATASQNFVYQVRISTTGYEAYRKTNVGAYVSLGSVALDMTPSTDDKLGPTLQIVADRNALTIYHRLPSVAEEIATLGLSASGVAITSGPVAQGVITFGQGSATARSFWALVAYVVDDKLDDVESTIYPSLGTTTALGDPARGRAVGAMALTIPSVGSATKASRLSLVAGPAVYGEEHTIRPLADYPIEHLFAGGGASPSVRWRSQVNTQEEIVFDLGITSSPGETLAVYIAGQNFASAYIDWSDSSTFVGVSTSTITMELGGGALSYDRRGDQLVPASTGATAARYLQEGELVGGYASFDGVARVITRQTAGWWSPASDNPNQTHLWLEGMTGSEAASGSDLQLIAPRGLMICASSTKTYPLATQTRRYWRLRIPVQTPTPDDYWEIGTLHIGRVAVVGAVTSWGSSWTTTPTIETSRDSAGTIRTRQLGTQRRRLVVDWQDPTPDRWRLEGADYWDVGAAVGVATLDDVRTKLTGLLAELQGGSLPCVVCTSIPTADGQSTITDPTLMLYGRMSGQVTSTNVVGDEESAQQMTRTESVSFEEIV